MRTRSGKEILEPIDLEIKKNCRRIKGGKSKMGDNNQDEIAFLRLQVQQPLAEIAAEKAEREEKERRDREIVPVIKMFNHGNVVTIPAGPPIDANNFVLRMPLINRVEKNAFAGRATEDVNRHLTKFMEIANTLKLNGFEDVSIRVRLFLFSLIDFAKEWYECLTVEKISKWDDIVALFLNQYYPPGTILKLKGEIFQFMQGHNEPLYEALAYFKALLRKCPNHGFGIDHQVGILYNRFNEKISAMLDSRANGGFLRKSGAEATEVIEKFAMNSRSWSKERHVLKRVAAVDEPNGDELSKELAALRARIDKMEGPKKEETTQSDIPSLEDVNYVQNGGGPSRPYDNNYRPN